MTPGPTKYFILVYDMRLRHVDVHEYDGDREAADQAYSAFEDEYVAKGTHEVVLIGADSIETIRRTHSPYFTTGTVADVVDQFLASID